MASKSSSSSLSRSKSGLSAASTSRSCRSGKSSSVKSAKHRSRSGTTAVATRDDDKIKTLRMLEVSDPLRVARSSDSWWGYLSELPFDESNEGDCAYAAFSPPISPSTWWEMKMEGSPSDEVDHFELEAASFEPKSYSQDSFNSLTKSTRKNADGKKTGNKLMKKKRNPITSVKSTDSAFQNSPYPGIPSKQTGTAIDEICKGSTAILDLLEKNVCPSVFIDSPTMRRFESNTILWDLQNKLEKVNHPALQKFLNRNQNDDYMEGGLSDDELSASSESCPPSPVSFSDVQNIISDLENDVHFSRNMQLNHRGPSNTIIPHTSKPPEKIGNSFIGEVDQRNRKSDENKETTPRLNNGRVQAKDLKQQLSKSMFAKSSNTKRESPFVPPSELKTLHMLTPNIATEVVPTMVNARKHESYEDSDHISTLTEERNPLMFPHLHEGRSCIPSMRILLKKIRNGRSSSSLSSTKLLGQSTAEMTSYSEPTCNKYVYGYETANHAYVAFLERGERGSDLVKMYEHPAPPSFEKMSSEVLVAVDVSTVSRSDCFVRRGEWWGEDSPSPLTLPIIPGSAFVGRVESEGERNFRKGDRVVSLVRAGANSRHIITDGDRLVKVSADSLSDADISCLPEIYLSAFQSLHHGQGKTSRYRKNTLSKKNILILGGSSTTGRALVEVAKAAGADAVYVTGREKEFGRIGSVGGLPLSKDPRHWLSILMGKMDIVVGLDDPYGTPQLKYEHIKALNSSGKVVIIGGPNPEHNVIDIDSIDDTLGFTKRKLVNYNVFDSWESDPRQAKRDLKHLVKLMKDGELNPIIMERLPLNKVAQAHDFLDAKQPHGFVLCEPWIIGKKAASSSDNGAFPTREVLW